LDTAAIYALCFAAAIVVLAVLATVMVRTMEKRRHKGRNKSTRDGEAVATWVGLDSARNGTSPDD
jgi:hypothetical protein